MPRIAALALFALFTLPAYAADPIPPQRVRALEESFRLDTPRRWSWPRAAMGAIAADVAVTCYGLEGRAGLSEGNSLYGNGAGCAEVAVVNAGVAYLIHRMARRQHRRCSEAGLPGKRCETTALYQGIFAVRASAAAWNAVQVGE